MDMRPPPVFIADTLGLDFLNSHATPVDTPVEWLASGTDLLDWLQQARLVPTNVATTLRKSAVPGELDAVAAQARALREWFRDFVKKHKGKPLHSDALKELAPLNQVLARDEEFGQVVAKDHSHDEDPETSPALGLVWSTQRRWRSPDALLLPIAKAMAELVCSEDFTHVKACQGHACTLLFIDRTRGHARRWCSMAVCGNRAKQAAHRDRAQRSVK